MAARPEPSEQRRFSRVPFDARVEVQGNHGIWESRLLDISLKGALIQRPDGWVTGTLPYSLAVCLGEDEPTIRMRVSLIHEEPGRVGFKTEDIDLESMSHLRRLVELNLGDAHLVDRELADMVEGLPPGPYGV